MENISVCLKAPNGKNAQHGGDCIPINIDDWIRQSLSPTSNYIVYNDEHPPPGPLNGEGGHCKGIIFWDTESIQWLVHSVPKWPASISPISSIPDGETEYGQSFACIKIPFDQTMIKSIAKQIGIMQAHVYMINGISVPKVAATNLCNIVTLTPQLHHVAKHSKWAKDIFEDCIAQKYGGKCITETWSRPGQPATKNVSRANQIVWPCGVKYNKEQDHSKICLAAKPWVYVGDINAMTSQFHRGGGGFMISDESLWNSMANIMK